MTRRCRFLAVVTASLVLPAVAVAQANSLLDPPPAPTGEPLVPPPDVRRPTWLEDEPAVVPAGASEVAPGTDTAWPVAHAGSACNFDAPGTGPSWLLSEPSSIQVLLGAYFSGRPGPRVPTFNYLPLTVRHGWDLGNLFGTSARFGGNWEFLADVTGAAITSSYGHWFAGTSFYLRRNWTEPGSTFVPYSQGGIGAVLNDAYREPMQRAVGQMFEFYLHAEVGLKYFVTPNMSLDVEGGLQHISNGGLANRNFGVNAFGGSVGFTYYFPSGVP